MPKSLSKDAKGNYYILQCSVEKMDNCVSAASGMLEYANKHFTQQVSFEGEGKGLVELPGSYQYKPIRYIKLTAPKSLVTPAVCRARKELEIALDANRYYFGKLADLRFRYPVAWDEKSAAFFALKPLYERAEENLSVLMDRDPHRGAIGCYSFPDECLEIARGVKGRLKEITAGDLAPLSEVTRWCYEFRDTPPMLSMPSRMLICSNGKAYASSSEFHDNTIRYQKGLWTSYSINVTQSYCSIQFSKAATSSITFRYDFADDGITSNNGYRVEDVLHNINGRMVAGVIVKHNSSFHIAPYTSVIDVDLECGKPAGATSDDL
jgi:hypothetical protein